MKIRAGVACIVKHGAAAAALLFAAAAYAQDFSILYHERLGQERLRPVRDKSDEPSSQKPIGDSFLSLTAFGRNFRIRLEPNELLLRRLPPAVLAELRDVDVLRGELVDVPGSWVRLTLSDAEVSGVIWDGAELFAIDTPARLAPHMSTGALAVGSEPVIYRWRDTAGTLTDALGAVVRSASDAAGESSGAAMLAPALDPGRQLDLGLVADSHLSVREGAGLAASMVSRANIVDGIFVSQLGLHVNVAELVILGAEADPFWSHQPNVLLDLLEDYRASTAAQRAQDLTHLLTGNLFVDPPAQNPRIVGMANLSAVCDERRGASLTQATFGVSMDALIMAHELGHNLGAPHDGQPGPCENVSTSYLMAPSLTSNREFSACSIEQMQPQLAAGCLDLIPPGDVEVRTRNVPVDAEVGREFELEVVVDNPSASAAYGIEVTATGTNLNVVSMSAQPSEGLTCRPGVSSPMCRRDVLPAGSSVTIRLVARTTVIAPATLQVSVHTLNDRNTANNVVSNTFAARPALSMVVDIGPLRDFVRVGELLEYSATVYNAGNITATNASAQIRIVPLPYLHVVAISSDVGVCAPDGFEQYNCAFGALAPGATRSLSLRLRAPDSIPEHVDVGYMAATVEVEALADQAVHDRVLSNEYTWVTILDRVANLLVTVPPPAEFELNAPVELAVTVRNAGPDSASNLVLWHNVSEPLQGLADVSITWSAGTCEVGDVTRARFICRLPTLSAGDSLVATVRGTAARAGQYSTEGRIFFRAFDPETTNNTFAATYTIKAASSPPPAPTPPPPSTPPEPPQPPPPTSTDAGSGGGSTNNGGAATASGGGGAADLGWLAVLALALAARTARRRTIRAGNAPSCSAIR